MPSNCVWLQIIFCSCVKESVLFPSSDRSCVKMADLFASKGDSLKKQTRWSNDKTIIELGSRKISWFVSVSQINYLPQPSALLASEKSRYFAQPCPIIIKWSSLLEDKNNGKRQNCHPKKWPQLLKRGVCLWEVSTVMIWLWMFFLFLVGGRCIGLSPLQEVFAAHSGFTVGFSCGESITCAYM